MKKPNLKVLNTILALGMFFIFAGFILALMLAGHFPAFATIFFPCFLLFCGFVALYVYIAFSRKPFKLFLSVFLILTGAFSCVLTFCNLPVTITELWPCIGIFAGIALVIAGRTTKKRFSLSYDLPAIFLFCSAVLYFLFSFEVIKLSFRQLAVISCPVLLIVGGILLVVLFLKRKALLELLPEEISKELNKEQNLDDNEEDDSGEIL